MLYVALLRGINVGGNNKVDMKQLKIVFEQAGMQSVATYINSGNVIFVDENRKSAEIVNSLQNAIEQTFGFAVKVLIRDIENIKMVANNLPATWMNDKNMKCDVMFLWENYDTPAVIDQLTISPRIEDVRYVPGAVLWRVDRVNVTKSGLLKIIGTDLYKHMTIRNCNTVRKLEVLMSSMARTN